MKRRKFIQRLSVLGAALTFRTPLLAQGSAASSSLDPFAAMRWGKGFESQRIADLGDGTFLNPIFAGDHPDPTILRDGENFYLTFSSFDAYPGIVIWQSVDLINWQVVTAALTKPIGSVWAPELVKHKNKFYCFIPTHGINKRSIYVITADKIAGPWSEPVDLHLPNHIDPGHAVDEQNQRWLFLSGGDRIRLADDGLSTIGKVEHVYAPWRYPDDWVVESFSPEGPKITRRGDWYYLVTAVGGTAGPPTGHMVIVARSKSLDEPWQNDPANPVMRTKSASEKWWSRGHATLFEDANGQWWMIHHGYENGYWTLGRQTLLAPVEWSEDGWPRVLGGDLSQPISLQRGLAAQAPSAKMHGQPYSDDFSRNRFGTLWAFYDPAPDEAARVSYAKNKMQVRAKGNTPSDASPICLITGDQRYVVSVDIEIDAGAEAGLLLFYNRRLYAGLGLSDRGLVMHRYGLQRPKNSKLARGLRIRLSNDRNILTIHTSVDQGKSWQKFDVQMEVSGYHHNVAYDFLSLRPALYVAGKNTARFSNFTYEAF